MTLVHSESVVVRFLLALVIRSYNKTSLAN